MHRCYIAPADWDDSSPRLSPAEEHHLLDVLRAGRGDAVAVFDGRGREAVARIESAARRGAAPGAGAPRVVLRVEAARPLRRPAVAITLLQALPKGARMDLIVEKATELGAAAILPLVSERVVARLGPSQRAERRARWQRIAVSAAKQCATPWTPDILPVTDFDGLAEWCDGFDLLLAGSLQADARPLRAVLDEQRRRAPARIGMLIGPEGDLTPAELRQAAELGAAPVSFGALVLRVETAALYALSVLAYEFLAAVTGTADPEAGRRTA